MTKATVVMHLSRRGQSKKTLFYCEVDNDIHLFILLKLSSSMGGDIHLFILLKLSSSMGGGGGAGTGGPLNMK